MLAEGGEFHRTTSEVPSRLPLTRSPKLPAAVACYYQSALEQI